MNIIKKIYCRVFQECFHMAIPLLPYREPELIQGFTGIPAVLERKGIHRIMLVTDPGVYGLGLTRPLEALLEAAGIFVSVYKNTEANPTSANVEEARRQYLQDACEGLIALGGGSSMDCAKGIGARLARPKKPLHRMEGILKVAHRIPLLIAIPTTAGTGSETTLAAVITDAETHHKYAINDFFLIPDYAVLEPEITAGLPQQLTATTGMDALTHAVEAYIGRSTTKQTRDAAVLAICLIFENLQRAYRDGTDLDARACMLKASYLAGTAFTKSYVGYVHAVAHSLGGCYGIAHGLANAVLLPVVLREYGESAYKKLARLARLTGISEAGSDKEAAEAFIDQIQKMNDSMNIPRSLPGIRNEDIPTLAAYADHEANPLYPVPALWNADELERIYHLVQEEKNRDRAGNQTGSDKAA